MFGVSIAQLVDVVDDLAQVVAAADLVLDLAEDLTDLVFDGVGTAGALFEAVQIGEEVALDEGDQVVAGQCLMMVEGTVRGLGGGPGVPPVGGIEDVEPGLAVERGLGRLFAFQVIEIFQEQEPGRLLGIIELGRTAGLFPEHVIDVLEGLFKGPSEVVCNYCHVCSSLLWLPTQEGTVH